MTDFEAQHACTWLATAVYSLMDQGDYEQSAALFASDGVWVRGEPVQGPQAILAALHKRPVGQLSRHIITNVVVKVIDEDRATATAIFVPLRGDLRSDGAVSMPAISSAGDLDLKFKREGGDWKISFLSTRFIFKD